MASQALSAVAGSSPHVRGALENLHELVAEIGIIPACAGSTPDIQAVLTLTRDHPRMCGEHTGLMVLSIVARGSSPHVRGAPSWQTLQQLNGRIIPACAGSTSRPTGRARTARDHPRMCGEHTSKIA